MGNQRTLTASEQAAIGVIVRLQAGHVLPCSPWSALQMSEIVHESQVGGEECRSRNATFEWKVGNDISTRIKLSNANKPTHLENDSDWPEQEAQYWTPISILLEGGRPKVKLEIDGKANVEAFVQLISGGPLFGGVHYPGVLYRP